MDKNLNNKLDSFLLRWDKPNADGTYWSKIIPGENTPNIRQLSQQIMGKNNLTFICGTLKSNEFTPGKQES